jgi:prephenate dehydrogenase
MAQFDTIAIVGVGLIGGSIGQAVVEGGLARRVIGIGRRKAKLAAALRRGAVSETTTSIRQGAGAAQFIVVTTPVDKIVEVVRAVAAVCPADALITDAGSTKARIVADLESTAPAGARFVGSHPLAGSEKTGVDHARADLFRNRVVVVTPTARTCAADTKRLRRFWSSLGAKVIEMSPAEHDRAVAATSHLPRLISAALAAATPEKYLRFASSGWDDATRTAAGDADLWRSIFASNRANVLKALARFEKTLAALRVALERDDDRRLQQLLKDAKTNRDSVGN